MNKIVVICIALLILGGCRTPPEKPELKPITLAEVYPGDIRDVNRIELRDGSSGEKKIVEDPELIESWISQIKHLELVPDKNQEGRVGFLYGISLYEGEELKFGFTPNNIQGIYYESNPEFDQRINALFEEQFGREF